MTAMRLKSPPSAMTRRRFLSITGLAGMTAGALSCGRKPPQHARESAGWQWNGILFGADVSLQLHGMETAAAARKLTGQCFREMRRLERMFSLFLPESDICQLNRDGCRHQCPPEFVAVIREACRLHACSDGAFDVTVQPLWQLMQAADFAAGQPDKDALAEALGKVGSEQLEVDGLTVRFARPGMAITLNGIAQGFITDRITGLLHSGGVRHALVNMGEYRALGPHVSGRAWELGIRPPGADMGLEGAGMIDTVPLENAALAVSGGYGHPFDAEGRRHHLLHPRTGESLPADRSVVVSAPTATLADALSTACAVLDDEAAAALCSRLRCHLRVYRGSGRRV